MVSAWIASLAVGLAGIVDGSTTVDRSAYEAAAASAGKDAEAQVRLALWCEARGMPAERTRHLMRAVLIDPENAKARGLLGQVKHDGRWMRPQDVAKAVEASPEQQALLREYLGRRSRTRDRADDVYKLALWCEEKGLKEPMAAHLQRTLQLDPGREGAWRRLGFKKVGSRWVNPEAEAALKSEREAQADADKAWRPRLEKLKAGLAGRNEAKRMESAVALAAVDDPRAVPSIWSVFARGGDEGDQRVAVDVFSRIDGPGASTALATLAVFSPHAAIRADSARVLARRDPRDFAGLLAGLIRKEIRYKVKNVEGPGTQGELLVLGADANVRRFYTPLNALVAPGTAVDPGAMLSSPISVAAGQDVAIGGRNQSLAELAAARQSARSQAAQAVQSRFAAVPQAASILGTMAASSIPDPPMAESARRENPNSRRFQEVGVFQDSLSIPIGQMVAETRYSALVAQQQLMADVWSIEMQNAPLREVNERAGGVLKAISGRDYGDDPEKWAEWSFDLQGYAYTASPRPEPPTYVEAVPLAFTPQAAPTVVRQQVGTQIVAGHSCFAAGTSVRTLQGARPIEELRPGDQVLAQDVATGEFHYRAVATVYHNPPNKTYRIETGRSAVVATGIHRLWKAGRGWVMARDLKVGDRLRTVGGSVDVTAVEEDRIQPVFNLQLVGGDNFCVGESGVVAHDNSFVTPVAAPFDGVPATGELVAASRR